MSATTRPRLGSSSITSRRRSSTRSPWICESLTTFAAACRITAVGAALARRALAAAAVAAVAVAAVAAVAAAAAVAVAGPVAASSTPTGYTTVYAESQNGNIQRLDLKTGRSVSIRPRAAQRPRGPGAARGGGQGAGQQPQPGAPAGAGRATGEGQQPTQEQIQQMIQAPS